MPTRLLCFRFGVVRTRGSVPAVNKKTSTSLKRGGALLIAKVGFDIESEMRLTLAESVEAERLTGSGKWAEHAPHANLTVVRPLLARAPLTAKLISRAT